MAMAQSLVGPGGASWSPVILHLEVLGQLGEGAFQGEKHTLKLEEEAGRLGPWEDFNLNKAGYTWIENKRIYYIIAYIFKAIVPTAVWRT